MTTDCIFYDIIIILHTSDDYIKLKYLNIYNKMKCTLPFKSFRLVRIFKRLFCSPMLCLFYPTAKTVTLYNILLQFKINVLKCSILMYFKMQFIPVLAELNF